MGILFAVIGPFDIVYGGPFGWHIRQTAFWQGGIELALLAALIGSALYFLKGWHRISVVLILCELYARHQGVDLAILVSLFYYEGIAALGTLIFGRLGIQELGATEKVLFGIMLGTLTWSCVQWILSAFGLGSVHDLQVAALLVSGGALLLLRRLPVLGCVFSHVGKRSVSGALLGAFMFTVVLMLFAKAGVSIDYDSLWYGLRGDRVLVAGGTVFKGLGLVSPAHYGPQAYELLLVPLMRLHSVTAILGFSIWCWMGLGICLYAIAERLHWTPKVRLFAVALALATPALMNIAITAKGDVMGAAWVLFGAYAIIAYRSTRHREWLVIAFFAALAATTFRMSVLPYAGLIGLFALCAFVISLWAKPERTVLTGTIAPRAWAWIALASTALFALVTARTLLLTGVPFAEVSTLVYLAERLGFRVRFPVGGPAPSYPGFNTNFPQLVIDFLFRPAKLPHIIIQWTGAAFAYFPLLGFAVGSGRRESLRNMSIFLLLAITFPMLLLFIRYPVRGGDGNYFIVPILSFVLLGAGMVGDRFCDADVLGRTLRWLACLFVVSSVLVSLATGSWGPGTRGWDLNFSRRVHDYRARASYAIDRAGLQSIDGYFKGMSPATRVVGFIPRQPSDPLPGSWLPVRYEALENIAWTRPDYTHSPDSIAAFLLLDHIKYVLLPRVRKSGTECDALCRRSAVALEDLQVRGAAKTVVHTAKYELWELQSA